jgi:phosphate transport system substrate-binding protein
MYRVSCRRLLTLVLLALTAGFLSPAAFSAEIVLELKGGDVTIRGELVASDGESYVVDAASLGRITVSRDKFTCAGAGCPQPETPPATASIPSRIIHVRGAAMIGERLFPQLIRDYSTSIGAAIDQVTTDSGSVLFTISQNGEPLVGIDVRSDSSASIVQSLAEGKTDIGLTSRQITDTEIGTLMGAGFSPYGSPQNDSVIGVDGIAIIVSPDNPVTALSLEDISRIFAGEITDWSEFGAPAGRISLYGPEPESDHYQAFADLVMKPYKRELRADALDVGGEPAAAVSADRFGIGFTGMKHAAPASSLGVKDTCGLVHTPSNFTVLTGEYPLSRKLYLHTGEQDKDIRSDIIRFALSSDGDRAVDKAGFVSKSLRTLPFDFFRTRIASSVTVDPEDLDIALLKRLMLDLEGGYRLSTTLRFEPATTRLEKESADGLGRLVAFLKEQDLTRRKILLAGYSDTSGQAEQNTALSLRRADAARQILISVAQGALKPEQIVAQGYGELFPISCNDTETGRDRNRRVEIWLLPADASAPSLLTKQL